MKSYTDSCVVAALLAISLILSAFIFRCLVIDDTLIAEYILHKDLLRELKPANPKKIVVGHLNINSIRNKFESLKDLIGKY